MPTLLNNINVPGRFNGLELEEGLKIGSYKDLVDHILSMVLIPYSNVRSIKKFDDFDTSYLSKAAEQGSEVNEFFTAYISPILDKLGKESDPDSLLSNIEDIKRRKQPLSDEDKKNAYTSGFAKKLTDDVISDFSDYLEDNNAYLNNFKGGSYANTPIRDIKQAVDYVNSTEDPKAGDISFNIYDGHIRGNTSLTVPMAFIVDGLKNEKGDDLGEVILGMVGNIPGNEDYLNIDTEGNISLSEEGLNKFRKEYLTGDDVYNYINHTSLRSSEKDEWTDTLKLLMDLIEKQKNQGINIEKRFSFFPKYYNKTLEPLRRARPTDTISHRSEANELVRKINRAKGTDRYTSLYDLANSNQFQTPKKYLQFLLSDKENKGNDTKNILPKSEIRIDYNKLLNKYHLDRGSKGYDPDVVFKTYEDHFNKDHKKDTDRYENPLPERKLQKKLNLFFSDEEKKEVMRIDAKLYDAIVNKNIPALKDYMGTKSGTKVYLEPFTLEHASPIKSLSDFLWKEVYLELKKRGEDPQDIKDKINKAIKSLYYEVLLSTAEDSYSLNNKLRQNMVISDEDKRRILNGDSVPYATFRRYKEGGVPTPVKISDMMKRFPEKIPGVTYSDLVKETKTNIAKMLFTYY